jgi:hypothetical protein
MPEIGKFDEAALRRLLRDQEQVISRTEQVRTDPARVTAEIRSALAVGQRRPRLDVRALPATA